MESAQPIKCEDEFEISLGARLFVYIGFTLVSLFCLYALFRVYYKAKARLVVYLLVLIIVVNISSCMW